MTKRMIGFTLTVVLLFVLLPQVLLCANASTAITTQVCEHTYDDGYYSGVVEGHYLECDHCTYYDKDSFEAHINDDNDDYCDLCDYTVGHEHTYDDENYIGAADGHYLVCDQCSFSPDDTLDDHINDENDDYCDLCGYVVGHTHTFEGEYYYTTAEGRYHECDHCAYYDEASFVAHINEVVDHYCDICGYDIAENHIYSGKFFVVGKNGHYVRCDLCSEYDENSLIDHVDRNNDIYCDDCGYLLDTIVIVLTWGETPLDLDSHLIHYYGTGGSTEVYYDNMVCYGADGKLVADLDVDDTTSYGPEHITIYTYNSGESFRYYVYDYSNGGNEASTSLANSGATVRVYQGDTLLATYFVPSNTQGYIWEVFSYSDDGLSALEHHYTENRVDATECGEYGYIEYNCTTCEDSYRIYDNEPLAHVCETVKENETESSYDLVTYCTNCNVEISRETVTIIEHKLTAVAATVPTYSTAGNTAYYKCVCGKYFLDAEGKTEIAKDSWVIAALAAGKDTTALVIKPTSSNTPATLMLGADLKLSFNVAVKTTTAYDSIFLEITKLGVTTEVELYSKSSTNHTFRYTLAAPEMTAEMTVVVCGVKDGKVYAGDPITFTYKDIVVDKMNAFYNGTNEKNKVQGCALLANLLKYGEEAQKRFGISTDNLATAGLSDTYKAMINTAAPALDTWTAPATGTYYLRSYTPMLQEQIKIAFTFAVPTYTSLEGYEVRIVQTKSSGVVTHTFGADVLKNTSTTRIRCDFAIAGAEGRDNLAITLYKDGAAVSATVNTNLSALSQGKQSDALNPLLYAMMNYCDAAKAFFG